MPRLGGLLKLLRGELLERLDTGEAAYEAEQLRLPVEKSQCLLERERALRAGETPVDLARELEIALVLDRQAQVREVLLGAQRADAEAADGTLHEGRHGGAVGRVGRLGPRPLERVTAHDLGSHPLGIAAALEEDRAGSGRNACVVELALGVEREQLVDERRVDEGGLGLEAHNRV